MSGLQDISFEAEYSTATTHELQTTLRYDSHCTSSLVRVIGAQPFEAARNLVNSRNTLVEKPKDSDDRCKN